MRLPFRFHAPWWAWLLTAVLVVLFMRLGFWQMHRAEEKKAMISAYQQAAKSAPVALSELLAAGDAAVSYARAMQVSGHFEAARSLLLDNQVSTQIPGYHVWTPLRLATGALVLVDRGWVPMNPDRRILPQFATPTTLVSLHGIWQPLPQPGLRLGSDDCDQSHWPRVVQYPLIEEVRCILGSAVLDGVLWLDPSEPHGFVRQWVSNDFPPERHYGYALQWFSLGLALLVLFVVVNLRRTER